MDDSGDFITPKVNLESSSQELQEDNREVLSRSQLTDDSGDFVTLKIDHLRCCYWLFLQNEIIVSLHTSVHEERR